jgi:protein phosphatase
VPDEKIAERLGAMKSSKQVAEQLVQDALDGGGSDNVTVVVGRAVPQD